MAQIGPVKEKIVKRKTIVYKTLVDPTVVKVAGEKLKLKLFARLGFLKPKSEDIEFVSIEKYYEPYILINAEYTIDYYRKQIYVLSVEERVREVIIARQKFKPEKSEGSYAKGHNLIKLNGEENLRYKDKVSLILDRTGHEVALERLSSAPSEEMPEKVLAELGDKARKLEISPDSDVDIVRSKIMKRPKDARRITHELFEVDERALIYTPIYNVQYRNLNTGEVKALKFDGITSKRI